MKRKITNPPASLNKKSQLDSVKQEAQEPSLSGAERSKSAALITRPGSATTLENKMFAKPKKSLSEGGENEKKGGWLSKSVKEAKKHQSTTVSSLPFWIDLKLYSLAIL